jgi:hypothetical protein
MFVEAAGGSLAPKPVVVVGFVIVHPDRDESRCCSSA